MAKVYFWSTRAFRGQGRGPSRVKVETSPTSKSMRRLDSPTSRDELFISRRHSFGGLARANRRGVLILISLVMLTLFLLLGTTYMVVTTRRRPCTAGLLVSSQTVVAAKRIGEQPDLLIGGAEISFSTPLLAAEETRRCIINKYRQSALLLDKYGENCDRFQFSAPIVTEITSSLMEVTTAGMTADWDTEGKPLVGGNPAPSLSPRMFVMTLEQAAVQEGPPYAGRILTVERNSYKDRNLAFRVISEVGAPANSGATRTFLVHQLNATPSVNLNTTNVVNDALQILIQGREFSGTNHNEDWDAPDDSNWHLAWLPTEAFFGPDGRPDNAAPGGAADAPTHAWRHVIPSFHRPDKLLAALKNASDPTRFDYREWLGYGGEAGLTQRTNLDHLLMLRPAGPMQFHPPPDVRWDRMGFAATPSFDPSIAWEHPKFTGSNIRIINGVKHYFDPLNGPWDVDNDGDGVADSVWMDIGADPVIVNGVECRPLVAILITDLDSRINLNVHGSMVEDRYGFSELAAQPAAATGSYFAGTAPPPADNEPIPSPADEPPLQASLPRGQSWGVADITPSKLLASVDSPDAGTMQRAVQRFRRILVGAAAEQIPQSTPRGIPVPQVAAEGRYGDAVDGTGLLQPAPGKLGVADPAIDAETGTRPKFSYLPNRFAAAESSLGSPIDPNGLQRVGIDQLGQPVFSRSPKIKVDAPDPWQSDRVDTPYDMSVGRSGPRPGWLYDPDVAILSQPSSFQDNLFTPSQLEKILRLFEGTTSTLSPRLASLLGNYSEAARLTVTTESWDTTAVCVPADVLNPLLTLSDQTPTTSGQRRPSLLSWDLQLGLQMDLNRPFGDGIDNDAVNDPGYRVVDEPGEYAVESSQNVYRLNGTPYADKALTNGRDVDGDNDVDAEDQKRARELFARHLYVLAIRCSERDWAGITDKSAFRRDIAQWAVNVADFRDPDSIMTRFQYDENFSPSKDTWNIDESTSPVVWGCERPELLITEAVAWRNIREDGDAPSCTWTDTGSGGLVIELYHPWTATTTEGKRANPLPAELAADGESRENRYELSSAIDLSKTNPEGEPVFQLVIIDHAADDPDKLRADPAWPRTSAEKALRRVLYLGTGDAATINDLPKDSTGKQYLPRSAAASDPTTIQPGQFALIGGPKKDGGNPLILPIQSADGVETAGLTFSLDGFSDANPVKVLELTDGLAEIVTAVSSDGTALKAEDRTTGRKLPGDSNLGPVGALLCMKEIGDAETSLSLRMPTHPTVNSPDLNFIENARYRVLLRRLASPLDPFDAKFNPYITIDSLSFQDHGVVHSRAGAPSPYGAEQLKICTAERCSSQQQPAGERSINNLWRTHDADCDASLSGQNGRYGTGAGRNTTFAHCGRAAPATTIRGSLGFLPSALKIPAPGQNDIPPFPWLPWLNRDFVSVHEIVLVPGSSPATLLRDHSHQWPFSHLFFSGGHIAPSLNSADLDLRLQPRFGLLEFLRVASRFADAELAVPVSHGVQISDLLIAAGSGPLFLPPHNYLSNFREPGRVNVNTVASPAVWDAVNNGRPGTPLSDEFRVAPNGAADTFLTSEDWTHGPRSGRSGNWTLDGGEDEATGGRFAAVLDRGDDANNDGVQSFGVHQTIASSRRGWPLVDPANSPIEDSADLVELEIAGDFDRILNRRGINGSTPTWIGNPFRGGWATDGTGFRYVSNQSLLLRTAPTVNADHSRPRLLFRGDTVREDSVGRTVHGFPFADPDRNPYFHYESVFRLSNKLTPRSNVFAVGMTVGFFTLDQQGRLDEEYGIASGDSRRHKTFMIIDRSIPVGFEPHGYEGNSIETVLWRHFAN